MHSYALPPNQAQARGVALLGPIALISLGPHFAIWGLPKTPFPTTLVGALLFLALFIVGVVLHEALHGIGHLWGGASWEKVQFGIHWSALTPFAECTVPTRARSYRLTLFLPGLVLGVFPLAMGLATGHWYATFYGFLMLTAAAGDLLVLWILVGVRPSVWVQDHPEKVGYIVMGDHPTRPSSIGADDLAAGELLSGRESKKSSSFFLLFFISILSAITSGIGFAIALG